MKISKINDNQIKCILTEQDLEDRHLNLREMSYNSAEIRKLFAEVINLAYNNLKFDANNVPLKIDVIPLRTSAVLFITKVEEPEELNPSYSHFSPAVYEKMKNPPTEDRTDLSESFRNLINALFPEGSDVSGAVAPDEIPSDNSIIYSFAKVESVIEACRAICETYDHCSSLYFDKSKNLYYLKLYMDGATDSNFRQNCISLLEYGKMNKSDSYFESYLAENTELLAEGNVVERMGGKKPEK